jgi:hypothetical protein
MAHGVVWKELPRPRCKVCSPRAPLQVHSARRTQQIGRTVKTCAVPFFFLLFVFRLGPFFLQTLGILRWGFSLGPLHPLVGAFVGILRCCCFVVVGGEVKPSRFVGYVCPLPRHASL